MNLEDYTKIGKSLLNLSMPESWYIVFPNSIKIYDFGNSNSRYVFFIVTDAETFSNPATVGFHHQLNDVFEEIENDEFLSRFIGIISYEYTTSENRRLKKRVKGVTVRYLDKISEVINLLVE